MQTMECRRWSDLGPDFTHTWLQHFSSREIEADTLTGSSGHWEEMEWANPRGACPAALRFHKPVIKTHMIVLYLLTTFLLLRMNL